ncbi:MAG: hypothetical protein HUK20_10915 [Fibrobacter sp.]|nr:hypothetical protein [Fibrobacter sp.]
MNKMIATPDFYNDFGELIQKDFQYKMDNNLFPDFSATDPLKLEKQAKNSYMATIDRLLKNCPINSNYEKSKDKLRKYTEDYINENFPQISVYQQCCIYEIYN